SCILSTIPRTTSSTLFPYTTLFRSCLRTIADQLPAEHPGDLGGALDVEAFAGRGGQFHQRPAESRRLVDRHGGAVVRHGHALEPLVVALAVLGFTPFRVVDGDRGPRRIEILLGLRPVRRIAAQCRRAQ